MKHKKHDISETIHNKVFRKTHRFLKAIPKRILTKKLQKKISSLDRHVFYSEHNKKELLWLISSWLRMEWFIVHDILTRKECMKYLNSLKLKNKSQRHIKTIDEALKSISSSYGTKQRRMVYRDSYFQSNTNQENIEISISNDWDHLFVIAYQVHIPNNRNIIQEAYESYLEREEKYKGEIRSFRHIIMLIFWRMVSRWRKNIIYYFYEYIENELLKHAQSFLSESLWYFSQESTKPNLVIFYSTETINLDKDLPKSWLHRRIRWFNAIGIDYLDEWIYSSSNQKDIISLNLNWHHFFNNLTEQLVTIRKKSDIEWGEWYNFYLESTKINDYPFTFVFPFYSLVTDLKKRYQIAYEDLCVKVSWPNTFNLGDVTRKNNAFKRSYLYASMISVSNLEEYKVNSSFWNFLKEDTIQNINLINNYELSIDNIIKNNLNYKTQNALHKIASRWLWIAIISLLIATVWTLFSWWETTLYERIYKYLEQNILVISVFNF
jgi:hypothetical protein